MIELVITAVGPDRLGLVDDLTGAVYGAGGNVADSRMVNLRGQFALLLLVEGLDEVADEVRRAVKRAGEEAGLSIAVSMQEHLAAAMEGGLPLRVRASAVDQPGLVHRITRVLHEMGVNIEQLTTVLQAASYATPPVFNIDMTVTAPAGVSVKRIREAIGLLCDELNCDVVIEPA